MIPYVWAFVLLFRIYKYLPFEMRTELWGLSFAAAYEPPVYSGCLRFWLMAKWWSDTRTISKFIY